MSEMNYPHHPPNEHQLRKILDDVSDLVQSIDLNGNIQLVNQTWSDRLGYPAAAIPGLNIRDTLDPSSCAYFLNALAQLVRGEALGVIKLKMLTHDGEPVLLEGRMTMMCDAGIPIAAHCVLCEITTPQIDNDVLKRRLRKQRRLFKSVLTILGGNTSKDRGTFLAFAMRMVSDSLQVARASTWLFNHFADELRCECLVIANDPSPESGQLLMRADHEAYFDAIQSRRPVRADDAHTHVATRSFTESYLRPLGITSMLDTPIRLGDDLSGVLCCEHVGSPRRWSNDEEQFLQAVSLIVLTFLENERRLRVEAELHALNQALERKVHERTSDLARSNERLEYLVTSSPVGIYSCEPFGDFRATYVSPNLEKMIGYPASCYLEDPTFWSDRIHQDDAPHAYERLRQALHTGQSSYEYRICDVHGNYRWMRDEFLLIRNEDGSPREIIGSCMDIDDRLRAEKTAEVAAEDMRRLIKTANAPIFGKDLLGKVNEWNLSAERLTGYSKNEVLGRELVEFVSKEFKPAVKDVLDRALGGIETANFEFPLVTKDSRHVTVLLNAGTRRDANDDICGMVGVGQDITQLRQADQRTLRAKRLESIGTLAGGVAHDINNALAPILLASGLLREQAPACVDLIDIIESSARRGALMVRQLLTFAKGVDGKRAAIESRTILKELEHIVGSTFPKNIAFELSIDDESLPVTGDATQLHQVLLNLCVNASDAMPSGGRILIEARRATITAADAHEECALGPYIVWRVSDTGCGIAPELLDRIFEPFFSTKSPDKGTGLGLSTALGIIRSHGGFMHVNSKLGAGTTFTVHIPMADESHTASIVSAPVPKFQGCGEVILIVEDEPAVREVFRQILTSLGFKVRTAQDGVAALAILTDTNEPIDGVITDLHMPNMDGLDLTREIRRIRPELGVILSSGRIDKSESAALNELGFVAQLEKPFSIEQLSEVLRILFRR